ncbi:hypothetical protein Q3A66_08800 [Hymenobacter sp. BT770]|uniref:hypothetical protein n=1 Tax=Hymenobacter sp. BT770 TaxID=2886942 RepID=UPI001D127424|nr:hypothetical protein [Hymenobacter sp. BT770]MCC3152154.1 hypothetical protein [Hymenobacter sp. BT770]MDO3415164.1 hypothetical protein [Hymenobacter sp. BT770]
MPAPTPTSAPEPVYSIPASYRKMENTHILFWLVKDISWCMIWKPLGLLMVVPTLGIALVIAWRTRGYKSELAHNLAIVFWIAANSYWMSSEFFGFDTVQVMPHVTGKHLALVPFLIGLGILLYYYLVQKPREAQEPEVATL